VSAGRLPVAVIGARGRLGSFAVELLREREGFELVACYDSRDAWIEKIAASGARVALEATRAGLGCEHGLALLDAGVRPLIATSGIGNEDVQRLDGLARQKGLGGLIVPNFSLGALLLQRFAADAARHFPDVEIVEMHHERKLDAPSATAAETARAVGAARRSAALAPAASDETRERGGRHGGVPIHSVRLPGLYAHQEVLLGAPGELLTLRHDMSGPAAFGPGILAGLTYAARAEGVARGLQHALNAPP
jgi:4-hydroxy-tetrahydrodipicolinate reductase